MSALNLRLPDSLHRKAKELAKKDHVSMNQFITLAVAEKIATVTTVDYLHEQGRLGTRAAYEGVLRKVRDRNREPVAEDRW